MMVRTLRARIRSSRDARNGIDGEHGQIGERPDREVSLLPIGELRRGRAARERGDGLLHRQRLVAAFGRGGPGQHVERTSATSGAQRQGHSCFDERAQRNGPVGPLHHHHAG